MALLGEFLKATPPNGGGRPQKTCSQMEQVSPTREELLGNGGRKVASDAQALADLRDTEPELFEEVRSGKKTVRKARAVAARRLALLLIASSCRNAAHK